MHRKLQASSEVDIPTWNFFRVRKFLASLGWSSPRPWLGNTSLNLRFSLAPRHSPDTSVISSGRAGDILCGTVSYNRIERTLRRCGMFPVTLVVSKTAARQCSRSEHLMASLALCGFTKNARSETKPSGCCPFCSFFPGDRQHLFWDCPARNSNRTEPSDLTEAVLGWPPVGGHSDTLSRLGRVRKEMLDHRYGGATPGGRGGRVSKDLCCFAAVHPR